MHLERSCVGTALGDHGPIGQVLVNELSSPGVEKPLTPCQPVHVVAMQLRHDESVAHVHAELVAGASAAGSTMPNIWNR